MFILNYYIALTKPNVQCAVNKMQANIDPKDLDPIECLSGRAPVLTCSPTFISLLIAPSGNVATA